MQFYQLRKGLTHLLPFELYKDRIVVAQALFYFPESIEFQLWYDYKRYCEHLNLLFIFNVTDEDLTHLNLLGLPVKRADLTIDLHLEAAVSKKRAHYERGR